LLTLPSNEVRLRHGIPLTSPSRTLLDLASRLTTLELEAALANARRMRLVRDTQIRHTLAAAPQRTAGIARLRALLDGEVKPRDTRSIYERKLLHLIDLAQLPRPATNVTVAGHLVDMFWPDAGLVVEFDSWAFHGDRQAFERDRARDQNLTVSGLRVTRVTAHQVDNQSYATIARLAGGLAAGRRTDPVSQGAGPGNQISRA
jgi:very-short-patch-repair endonuclease